MPTIDNVNMITFTTHTKADTMTHEYDNANADDIDCELPCSLHRLTDSQADSLRRAVASFAHETAFTNECRNVVDHLIDIWQTLTCVVNTWQYAIGVVAMSTESDNATICALFVDAIESAD